MAISMYRSHILRGNVKLKELPEKGRNKEKGLGSTLFVEWLFARRREVLEECVHDVWLGCDV